MRFYMKKVLFVATVVKKHINAFHLPYLKWFQENGYETHVCASNDFENQGDLEIPFCDKYYDLSFERSPFKFNNIKVYKNLKNIIDENNYDIIHCHTPMGGVLTRIASKAARTTGTKVIYTAHGFHFYKGAPLKNWLLYYPIEKWLSKYTDSLVTINDEDHEIANRKFKVENVSLINGVGVNFTEFIPQTNENKQQLRKMYGYTEKDFILIYVGELSYRKQQDFLIDIISRVKNEIPNIKLLFIGEGELLESYKTQSINLGVEDRVEFLGFRKDISNLMVIADVAVSSSRQEGLPVNIMEAMSTGLPIVVTDCRGNRDLIENEKNGFVISLKDREGFAKAIVKLNHFSALRQEFSNENLRISTKYSLENVMEAMTSMYKSLSKD